MPFSIWRKDLSVTNHQSHFINNIYNVSPILPRETYLQKPLQMQNKSNLIKVLSFFRRRRRRVSASASLKGSLTIEAALSMSLFLLSIHLLFYFFSLMEFQTELQFALEYAVRTRSIYCSGTAGLLAEADRETEGSQKGIRLGAGKISVVQNVTDDPEIIDVSVFYEAGPKLTLWGPLKGRYLQRCRRRRWSGQERISEAAEASGDTEEETVYVYITQNGTVYHSSRECSYLSLSVRQTAGSVVSSLRNADGEKYRPCESCGRNGKNPGVVYITDTGNRYHWTKSCGGLRRWVIKIPFSEAGARQGCSRCNRQ